MLSERKWREHGFTLVETSYLRTYVQNPLTLVTTETDYGVGEVVSVYVVYVCVNCS